MIVLSPTDAASQEAVVGLAQHIVVARARAPRDAAIQHCLEYLDSGHPDLSSWRTLGRSYCSRVYFRKLHHELGIRRLTSMDRSVLWWTVPPRYTNSFVWLYNWPAASTLNVAVGSEILFVCKHMISVLTSETVRPNTAHTTRSPLSPSSAGQV